MWFPNGSDTNQTVQSQKRARSLKFRILEEEAMYYPYSENKDADQLRGYREADLRLCFRICRLLVFSRGGSIFIKCCQKVLPYKGFGHIVDGYKDKPYAPQTTQKSKIHTKFWIFPQPTSRKTLTRLYNV